MDFRSRLVALAAGTGPVFDSSLARSGRGEAGRHIDGSAPQPPLSIGVTRLLERDDDAFNLAIGGEEPATMRPEPMADERQKLHMRAAMTILPCS